MNFDWTDEQKEIQKAIGGLLGETAQADALMLETADGESAKNIMSTWLKELAELNYLAFAQGPVNAGQAMQLVAAQEALAPLSNSLFVAVETSARLLGGLVAGFGADETREKILDPLNRGEMIGAVAVAENESREAPGLQTIATSAGDGYVLNGRKNFVANGPIADVIAVYAKVGEQTAFFLVEAKADGVTLGKRIKTMGCRGLTVCALELNDVHVEGDAVIGLSDDEAPLHWLRMAESRVQTQASIGLMKRLLDATTTHAKSHRRNGRAIIKYQEVGFKLAEMLTLLQTAQWYGRRVAYLVEQGSAEASTVSHCAKVFTAETGESMASAAMQIFAGEGFVEGSVAERGYRDAKYAALTGLSCETARMQIADDVLAGYRE